MCWAPSERANRARQGGKDQPEPCWAARKEGQGLQTRGPTVAGRRACLDPQGTPASQPAGNSSILGEVVTGQPCEVKSPVRQGLKEGLPSSPPAGRTASPSSPLKAESFSGRFSSSLYFWSHRNSYRGKDRAEQGLGDRSP